MDVNETDPALAWKPVESDKPLFDNNALWEAGFAQVVYLRFRNVGSLALKYKFAMTIENETPGTNVAGDSFLLSDYIMYGVKVGQETKFASRTEAIGAIAPGAKLSDFVKEDFLLAGETDYLALVVYMPTTVGNEANYIGPTPPSIELGISLVATQYTAESDSFDNQYDANAGYLYIANTAEELQKLMANAQPGDTIVIGSGVSLGTLSIPEGLNGVTLVSDGANVGQIVIAENNVDDVTFDGFNLITTGGSTSSAIWVDPNKSIQKITFRNTTITGTANAKDFTAFASGNAGASLVIENCTFNNVGRPIYDSYAGYKEVTIRNCSFINNSSDKNNGLSWAIALYGQGDKAVTVDNCIFDGCTAGIMKVQGTSLSSFTFTNNTMIGCADHPSYGLFQLRFTDSCVKTVSGNTFDGADFNDFAG